MKNNIYLKYSVTGGIIGIFFSFLVSIISIPILTDILYYIAFSFISDGFIQGIGENIWIFVTTLLISIFVFALYGFLFAFLKKLF